MLLKTVPVTDFMTNCYILADEETKEALVIDPGGSGERLIKIIKEAGLKLVAIVNTHAHIDHIGANQELKAAFGCPIMLHKEDEPIMAAASQMGRMFGLKVDDQPGPDRNLSEGDEVAVGSLTFKVAETPGHSPGGICLIGQSCCFVGDTLFAGSIGRTDLPGGDYNTLIRSITEKLMPLDDDMKVYTGHGPATTIGTERRTNPFLMG